MKMIISNWCWLCKPDGDGEGSGAGDDAATGGRFDGCSKGGGMIKRRILLMIMILCALDAR